jgi:hypothetical protein
MQRSCGRRRPPGRTTRPITTRPKVTLLVLGWAGERFHVDGLQCLTTALDSIENDQLAAALLRSMPPTPAVLLPIDAQSEGVQEAYWRAIPYEREFPTRSIREYARHLLGRDLAWSAAPRHLGRGLSSCARG